MISWLQWLEKKVGCPCSLESYGHFSTDRAQYQGKSAMFLMCACTRAAKWRHKLCAERMRNAIVRNHLETNQAYWKLEHVLCMSFFCWRLFCFKQSLPCRRHWMLIYWDRKKKGRLDYWTVPRIYCCTFMAIASVCLFITREVKWYKWFVTFNRGVTYINTTLELRFRFVYPTVAQI